MRLLLLLLVLGIAPGAFAQDPVGYGIQFGYDREGHSLVVGMAPDSEAARGGMQLGDLILALHGHPMPLYNEGDALGVAQDSLPVRFTVLRGGDSLSLSIGIGPFDLDGLYRNSSAYLCASGDCVDGEGLWVHPSGLWYQGSFRVGRRHGTGVLTEADGRVYSGDFANQLRHGHGLYRWPDNTYWEGDWADGNPQGTGLYTDENGTVTPSSLD